MVEPPLCKLVTVSDVAETQAVVTWSVSKSASHLEPTSGFILFLRELSVDGESQAILCRPQVCTGQISHVLTKLKPCTDYDISVASIIEEDFGPLSRPLEFTTRGGEEKSPYALIHFNGCNILLCCLRFSHDGYTHFITSHIQYSSG